MITAATETNSKDLSIIANRLRRDVLRSTNEAGSGHPTSCFSCAELVSTLFFDQIEIDVASPASLANDHFILSKGHAAPILWSALKEANLISDSELLDLRSFDSAQEGHPTPRSEWVQIATGSLGQGLSAGVGMALMDRREERENRTYVLCGDGEMAEGSVWEAASLASALELNNLALIVDVNAYGQTGSTLFGGEADVYRDRLKAFGWNALVIDGHDIPSIIEAFDRFELEPSRPTAIVAKTTKGKGVSSLEGEKGSHGKVAPDFESALAEIPDEEPTEPVSIRTPDRAECQRSEARQVELSFPEKDYPDDEATSPRKVFGKALDQLGSVNERVWAFDGDVGNSTYTETFQKDYGGRFVQSYIAEQNMIGMATGVSALGGVPFVSTFAAFLTRAHDQVRMAAVSRSNIKFAGTHVGIATGQDGPSQMGLEDIALFRCIPGSVVLQPSDPRSVFGCMELLMRHQGIGYLRLFRPSAPTLRKTTDDSYRYRIGGSHTLRQSEADEVAIVASGITVHYALDAARALADEGVRARVIDCYSIKPIDAETLRTAARGTGNLVVVEDHYTEGGLGEAAAAALAGISCKYAHLSVGDVPRSGSQSRLASAFGIDASAIARSVMELRAA